MSTVAERQREKNRQIQAGYSRERREIPPVPPVSDPARRREGGGSLKRFCEIYFKHTFILPWSRDHVTVLDQMDECIKHGGQYAMAMPRGSGKTSIVEVATIYSQVNGHHAFVAGIGSDATKAEMLLESIKNEYELNDLLWEDYPEVCSPIRALEGIANRCKGQIYRGRRTYIEWTSTSVALPMIDVSEWMDRSDHAGFYRPDGYGLGSGAAYEVGGLTGAIRGMKRKRPDGVTIRPSLVILDDPQTDESARSPKQCATRERIVSGAVLGMAGPGRKISAIMPCTVICKGDMADNVLNREKHPEWNGTRTKLLYSLPTDEDLWDEYARILMDGLRHGDRGRAATEFYRRNRVAMDAGADPAWPERFEPGELSAIQHAMNIKILRPLAFASEYQNEPIPELDVNDEDLTADDVAGRVNRLPRYVPPTAATRTTGMIDVQGNILFYVICSWDDDFTGYILDYGTFPDQRRDRFTASAATRTLEKLAPGAGLEGRIYAGLDALVNALMSRDWTREDGASLPPERILIDAQWGLVKEVIYRFCRESTYSSTLMPSHGVYVGASSRPMSEYRKNPGDRVGMNWRMPSTKGRRGVRSVHFDSNFWKSFIHSRFGTARGDRGSLTFFGQDPTGHALISEHVTSEYRVRTTGRGRQVDEWKPKPHRPDNHWFDCLVGSAVGASIGGSALRESAPSKAVKRRRREYLTIEEMTGGTAPGG